MGQHVDQIAPEDGSVDVEEALLRLDVVLDLFDFLGVDVGVGVADDLDNLRLKTLRTEAGWSQAELAEKIDSDARQVSRYENNKVAPGLEAVIRMAQVFNVTVDYLLIDDAERRPLTLPTATSTPGSPTSTSSPTKNAPPSATSSTPS